ncbi:MAG: RidA family protein [Bradymonadia bacterium]
MKIIHPEGWAPAKGYANGMLGEGKVLFIAGQIGWGPDQVFVEGGFLEQFDQALANVVAVVEAAGGAATDLARMVIYVTDIEDYRRNERALGPIWRARMGRHFPAMALVAVSALVERQALLEIEAHAIL